VKPCSILRPDPMDGALLEVGTYADSLPIEKYREVWCCMWMKMCPVTKFYTGGNAVCAVAAMWPVATITAATCFTS